jgi:formate dehydrogenase subunit gamma
MKRKEGNNMAKMVQKTSGFERFVHGIMAISGIILLLTGFGFLYQQELGWLNTMFGGQHIAKVFHNWGGILFAISVFFALFMWIGQALSWSKEDSEGLGMLGGYFSKDSEPPPQGKMNAGQKLVVWCVVFFGILISISGFVMWLNAGSKGVMTTWHLVHNISFFVFAILMPIHIYLATAANPGTFRIMTKGDVPVYWAKKKHAKWVKEMGLQ